ncbi:hypothetical protein BN1708_010873 [Verticillium longisporum]|uniref:Uncharacterized protein n=1 Tax=Verticillium longisporum TaxID=100787 RepID=A0A0G4KVV5_VERLO|nr:hypothetical protein BN1708_010873 [Verticillium longisporum]
MVGSTSATGFGFNSAPRRQFRRWATQDEANGLGVSRKKEEMTCLNERATISWIAISLRHWSRGSVLILKLAHQVRNDSIGQILAGDTNIFLVSLEFRFLVRSLRQLAAEGVGVKSELELREIDAVFLLLGSCLSFGRFACAVGSRGLLCRVLRGFLLRLSALRELFINPLLHLLPAEGFDKLGTQHGHAPGDVQGCDSVKIEHVLASISSHQALSLNTGLQVDAFALLVPNWMLLNPQRTGQFLKDRDEAIIRSYNILAFHSAVVDLILTRLTGFKNAGNNALANDTLSEVVDDNCCSSEEAVNVQLVH